MNTNFILAVLFCLLVGCSPTGSESTQSTDAVTPAKTRDEPTARNNVTPAVDNADPLAALDLKPHAQGAVDLGWRYFQRGDRETALKRFQMAVRHDAEFAAGYYGIAFVHSVQGDLEQAITNYRKTIELDPSHVYAHANLGYALLQLEQDDEAQQMLDKALSLHPDCAEAHLSYANYYAREKAWSQAGKSANKAVELGQQLHPEFQSLLKSNGVTLKPEPTSKDTD